MVSQVSHFTTSQRPQQQSNQPLLAAVQQPVVAQRQLPPSSHQPSSIQQPQPSSGSLLFEETPVLSHQTQPSPRFLMAQFHNSTPPVQPSMANPPSLVPAHGFVFNDLPSVAPDLKRRYKHGRMKTMVAILDSGSTGTSISSRALEHLMHNAEYQKFDGSSTTHLTGVNVSQQVDGSVLLSGFYSMGSQDFIPFRVFALVNLCSLFSALPWLPSLLGFFETTRRIFCLASPHCKLVRKNSARFMTTRRFPTSLLMRVVASWILTPLG